MKLRLSRLLELLRHLSGDDAYERYLHHWQQHHALDGAPPDRKTFFKSEQERKWNGVRRCC
ncbi:MAG: CstA-like transporter-associated (seleno)protein [Gammaproteobacteria bacterium]